MGCGRRDVGIACIAAVDYYCADMTFARLLIAPLIAALALLGGAPAHAAHESGHESKPVTVRVYHQAITPVAVLVTPAATVRTFFGPIAVDGKAADGQYITGTLTITGPEAPNNPSDLDGDGVVGAQDLAALLGNWGNPGLGDIDVYGVVGPADLATLLGAWG